MDRQPKRNRDYGQVRETKYLELVEAALTVGGYDDPKIEAAIMAYAQFGKQSVYEGVMRKCIAAGSLRTQFQSQGFELPFSAAELPGEGIKLGRIVDTEIDFCIAISDLAKHGCILGMPGVGKTVLLRTIILGVIQNG